MATTQDVLAVVQEVEAAANEVLGIVGALDPALGLPTATIKLLEDLANKALAAYAAAANVEITVASVAALAPKPMPPE